MHTGKVYSKLSFSQSTRDTILYPYQLPQDLGSQDMKPVNEINITKTRLFKYIEHSTTKNWKFSDKNSDNFHIST